MMILDYVKSNPITSQANVAKGINKNVNAVKSAFARLKKVGRSNGMGKTIRMDAG